MEPVVRFLRFQQYIVLIPVFKYRVSAKLQPIRVFLTFHCQSRSLNLSLLLLVGIAGIVKGLGILSLKQLDIMNKLTVAVTDKKNPHHREGALFAFEMLCNMLGRLFEPYIVHMLPNLLLCFGDPVDYVRQAADETAKGSNLLQLAFLLVWPL